MTRTLLFAFALSLTAGAATGQDNAATDKTQKAERDPADAKAILEEAVAGLKNVKYARYDARYVGTGWVKALVADVEGSAWLGRPSRYDITRFRCEVKLTPPASGESDERGETIELIAGSDGELFFLIDPKTKTVHADIDEAVLGKNGREVQRVLMKTLVSKEPLAEELKAEKAEVKEDETVAGEECYQIHVTMNEARETVWFFSKRDFLPRRVVRWYQNAEGERGSTQLVISNLATKPTPVAGQFGLTVPIGFTQTEEFAP